MHTRIAPTPSGYLHAGNACSFLLTQQLARQHNGTLRLRIDDIDNERTRPEYLAGIFEVLHYLEIEYNYGPADVADFQKNYSQHLRLPLYDLLLKDLCDTGLVYACACSRRVLVKNNGQCYCRVKNIPLATLNIVWRLHMPDDSLIHFVDEKLGKQTICPSQVMAHPIVRKRDGLPAYQVASVADDLHYGVNYIVRGEDLLPSTAVQLYIAQVVGRESFLRTRFFHHPLLKDLRGEKLSKSAGATAISTSPLKENNKDKLLAVVKQWMK